jgi:hypothetical protein
VRKLQEDSTEPRPFAQGWIAISKSTSFDRHAGRGRARSDSGSSQESSSRNAHTNVGGYVHEDGSPERSALPVHTNSPYTASNRYIVQCVLAYNTVYIRLVQIYECMYVQCLICLICSVYVTTLHVCFVDQMKRRLRVQ